MGYTELLIQAQAHGGFLVSGSNPRAEGEPITFRPLAAFSTLDEALAFFRQALIFLADKPADKAA